MLRRLHPEQPESFAFTTANREWAEGQIAKYPEGRQASAVIPLLWRAQEQEGWVSRPAIETVAEMLGLADIRVLEVATFYYMFQLQPVGSVAHVQICGTTSCMICGAEDLIGVCRSKIAPGSHELSADGKFSWEEVECLGACANAPMAQIGKDYYEDLTAGKLEEILDVFARGEVPEPGPQNGRFASEPLGGATTLKDFTGEAHNGSVTLALELGDTVARITGEPISRPSVAKRARPAGPAPEKKAVASEPRKEDEAVPEVVELAATVGVRPKALNAPRSGKPDDLKRISGIGPKLEKALNAVGYYHFDQIAGWTDAEIAWIDDNILEFRGRITRDDWVGQAKAMVEDDGGTRNRPDAATD